MNERETFTAQAQIDLDAFLHAHPQFSMDNVQPTYRGGTNYITLGHCGEQPIVFKSFIRTYRWAHELFCLRHFAPTGVVPQILAVVPEQLIVMTRWADNNAEIPWTLVQRAQLSEQIGQAVATLVQWPLPNAATQPAAASEFEQFVWREDVEQIARRCVALCRQIQRVLPRYQTDFFTASLDFVEAQIDYVAQQPRLLFHEDISNFSVDQGQFQGFYDLEMMRIGTEPMQLGVVVDLICPHWREDEWLVWPSFLQGYQAASHRSLTERDFQAILAMNHFYYHIRLCRWGKWDGDPAQTGNLAFATKMAEPYFKAMQRACANLRGWVDVDKWFPGLV
jgi:hypothetical protein